MHSCSSIEFIYDNTTSQIEKYFKEFQKQKDKNLLFNLKRKLEDRNERFLVSYELSQYKDFHFNSDDALLEGLNFIDFFTSLCDSFRLEKFRYFIDDYCVKQKNRLVDLETPFDIHTAFPDANTVFSQFMTHRVNLFYLDYLIDQAKTVDHSLEKDTGNLELFKPGSEFSKIFNDQNEIPDLIYNHISKVSLEDDYINSFFSRLRIILRHSTYKNEVLMKKNKASTSIFKNIVSKFTGSEYKYTSEVCITKEFESDLEDFKKLINHKSLDIKLMKLQFPK